MEILLEALFVLKILLFELLVIIWGNHALP